MFIFYVMSLRFATNVMYIRAHSNRTQVFELWVRASTPLVYRSKFWVLFQVRFSAVRCGTKQRSGGSLDVQSCHVSDFRGKIELSVSFFWPQVIANTIKRMCMVVVGVDVVVSAYITVDL